MRLQKHLAACGVGSRRHCEALIAAGAVTVDGRVVTEQGVRVDPDRHRITVHGRPLQRDPLRYWALHKPAGCVTTCHDPQGRRTFLDYLPPLSARVYPVGRLDYESEGLLLVTNDGDLAHRLMHPRHEIEKEYEVRLDRPLTPAEVSQLRNGITIEDVTMRMAGIRPAPAPRDAAPLYAVRLREGRNRQIRRMMAAIGRRVLRLKRVRLGPLALGPLPSGRARPLTAAEIVALRQCADLPPLTADT